MTAALGVIAAVAVLLTPSEAVPTGLFGPSGVRTGTVKPGDGYNVRAGPSTATSKIDALPAGTAVVVECLDGSWSRLAEPHAGGYIASNGLELTEDPPPC